MCGTMDGKQKTKVLSGQFNKIAIDWIRSILFVSHEKYFKRYGYSPRYGEQSKIVNQDNLLSMHHLDKYYSSESIDFRSLSAYYRFSFSDIIAADKKILIGLKYIYTEYTENDIHIFLNKRRKILQDDKAYYFFTQNVYHLNESSTLVKYIDERKEKCEITGTC